VCASGGGVVSGELAVYAADLADPVLLVRAAVPHKTLWAVRWRPDEPEAALGICLCFRVCMSL
jgi:hypothetical protein